MTNVVQCTIPVRYGKGVFGRLNKVYRGYLLDDELDDLGHDLSNDLRKFSRVLRPYQRIPGVFAR